MFLGASNIASTSRDLIIPIEPGWRYDWASRQEENRALAVSKELLRAHLSDDQRACFDNYGHFYVVTCPTYFYRITSRAMFNIDVIGGTLDRRGKPFQKLCTRPSDNVRVPIYDKMLADKVRLESNEHSYVRLANQDLTWPEWHPPVD